MPLSDKRPDSLTRRRLLGSFAAAVAFPEVCFGAPSSSRLDRREELAVDFMNSLGVTDFLLLNKRAGVSKAVTQSGVQFSVPALSGQERGDELNEERGATAAGIQHLRFSSNQKDAQAFMMFKDCGSYAYVIHRAFNGPIQRREDRLRSVGPFKSSDPDQTRRITAGCVGVLPAHYDLMSSFAASNIGQVVGPDTAYPVMSSTQIVLPETLDLGQAREFYAGEHARFVKRVEAEAALARLYTKKSIPGIDLY